jgi:hypothetical protein
MEGPHCCVGLPSWFIVTRGEEEINSNYAFPEQRIILCKGIRSNFAAGGVNLQIAVRSPTLRLYRDEQ